MPMGRMAYSWLNAPTGSALIDLSPGTTACTGRVDPGAYVEGGLEAPRFRAGGSVGTVGQGACRSARNDATRPAIHRRTQAPERRSRRPQCPLTPASPDLEVV